MKLPSIQRIWAMFIARNHEFFRDRAAFGWNFLFPFLLILGFGMVFSGKDFQQFKVGVFPVAVESTIFSDSTIPEAFRNDEHIIFIPFTEQQDGESKLKNHKIDLLLDVQSPSHAYWINDSSPNGVLAEKIFLTSFFAGQQIADKKIIQGKQVRYIDWLFPGVLAMNMMFSAFWGVGFIVVRYRKNGALKRLKATPLSPFEYLASQMMSRIFLLMFTLVVVWFGVDLVFDFTMQGSYLLFLFVFFLGGINLCSLGLILASRGTSEEFTSGILNFISYPMMFLSEVWFSLEGAPKWVTLLSEIFPLTYLLRATRKIMNEGSGLAEIQTECAMLIATTILFLLIASKIFSWNR